MPESQREKIQRALSQLVLHFSYSSVVLNVCLKGRFWFFLSSSFVLQWFKAYFHFITVLIRRGDTVSVLPLLGFQSKFFYQLVSRWLSPTSKHRPYSSLNRSSSCLCHLKEENVQRMSMYRAMWSTENKRHRDLWRRVVESWGLCWPGMKVCANLMFTFAENPYKIQL